MSQEKSAPSKGGYDLRHPGLIMKDGDREVHEFTGMWPLKPNADMEEFTKTLAFSEFCPAAQDVCPMRPSSVHS